MATHDLEILDAEDLPRLMRWFPDAASTELWSGSFVRFPFDRQSFEEDLRITEIASYTLKVGNALIGFGQFYGRYGRVHLARLAINPAYRGSGWGRVLVNELMSEGSQALALSECGLFVFEDNLPAVACYLALGFERSDCPDGEVLGGRAIYMTRPLEARG